MKKILYFCLILFNAYVGYSFQWPVADPVLVTSFGESKFGSFSKGIEIKSSSDDVHPIASGEVVFYRADEIGSKFPSPLGNFAVVQHERGIFSIYSHLGKVFTENYKITETGIVGTVGSTGLSEGKALYLVLLDGEFEQYINPLLSLPPLPDLKKPRIGSLYFVKGSQRLEVEKDSVIKTGIYSIQVEIKDYNDNGGYYSPVAPFSISLYINGENKKNIKFETIKLEDGKTVLQNSSDITYGMIYESPWLYKVGDFDLAPGKTQIELAVKDFEGNESSRIVRITVSE